MSEHEPTARIGLNLEVHIRDIPELIEHLGSVAVDRVRIGEQHMAFLEDMEKDQLKENVSIHSVRSFYHRYFQDDTPSPLATMVFNAIGKQVAETDKRINDKGQLIEVSRTAWDTEVHDILQGKSQLKFRKDTKRRRFIQDFQAYLPTRESGE